VEFRIGGNTPDTINSVASLCLLGLLLAVVVGCLLDRICAEAAEKRGSDGQDVPTVARPPMSAILLLAGSYALLLPGLYGVLFSFNIMLDFGFIKLGVTPGGGLNSAPPFTETMMGLITVLRETGASTGAHAVIFYALIIPTTKLIILILGQSLRCYPKVASLCTKFVQAISKWACPDMFAYILLQHLVRGMNHPNMLRSTMQLDLGFTCFSLFCVGSTFASLGMKAGEDEAGNGGTSCLPFPRWLSGETLMGVVMALFCAFAVCFQKGLTSPIMALRIHTEVFFAPKGPIPEKVMGIPTRPVIEQLKIPEKANTDVSLMAAMTELQESSSAGEVNCTIALLMVGGFVIALTLIHMIVLVVAAMLMRCGKSSAGLLKLSTALRKLSMLDVLIMGVIVVVLCMAMYKKDGIIVTSQYGLWWLAAAEAMHYITFFIVTGATDVLALTGKYADLREDMIGAHGRDVAPVRCSREVEGDDGF